MSRPLVVIPARMGSSRLPGKALAPIAGRPMILHVLEKALAAAIGPVAVATDSPEIAAIVAAAGGRVAMTSGDHACGSDRVGEAVAGLDPAGEHDIIVNLQGDQPNIAPDTLATALEPLADPEVDIATLAAPAAPGERDDPNSVKLIGAEIAPRRMRALYFTRAPAPYDDGPDYHHIGVYAFRRTALARFAALPPSALELRERLEQLRALEAGMRIDAMILDKAARGVDTSADLQRLRAAQDKDERSRR
ncbi:3-deoxy-manno-octulosonate cytidylyltransferase [Methylosinus sp. RM1]|uniref:3-deoxy-manno-octulosonate cytidylyltransferase n=1 Tax=Methylosinus sp. RM1 TaxID=2583817 RepID=UPI00140A21D3|nr:3-deoxy-manno-octulosonate cytidylyltransferase [Methylosinus sp. RM1]